MRIINYLLIGGRGEAVRFVESPNQSADVSPLYLIFHYTETLTLGDAISWFVSPKTHVSAHLVIGRDGAITQMVPFNRRAWHAGASSWGNLKGMNQYSIGIELANAGKLCKRPDGQWADQANNIIPAQEVSVATHKREATEAGWHRYTEAQLNATIEVSSLLNSVFRFIDVLGHDDVSPGRKIDPGPLFPLADVASRIFGRT